MANTCSLTEGKPLSCIVRFMLPVLGCNLLQQFYSLIDTALVGHILGDTALAAVGATTFICNLLLAFATGLTSGFAILSAQDWGTGDRKGLQTTAAASFLLTLVITCILTLGVSALLRPLLHLLRTPEAIFPYSYRFLLINVLGLAASMLYNLATALLRSVGKSTVPLVILICCLGINLVLALVFLYLLGWGVAGAALATVTAQLLSAGISWTYLLRTCPELRFGRAQLRDIQYQKVLRLLRAGLAMLLCVSIPEFGSIILQAAVNTMGTVAITAYTVGRRVINVTMAPLNAIGIAMATYVSQNLGAGKPQRIRQGMRTASIIQLVWSVLSTVLVFCLCRQLSLWISGSSDTVMLSWAEQYMCITNLFYPFVGVVLLYRQALQSLGDQFVPILCSCLEVIVKALVVFFLPAGSSFMIICLTEPATWILNTAILLGIYFFDFRKGMPQGGYKRMP